MEKVKYIFVVLVYRTDADIPSFVKNVSRFVKDYKILIVNSFFDEESLQKIKQTAMENQCDFLPIENKGYGYGNNCGIEYANGHYDYEYLIVCNSDIEILKFDDSTLSENVITAPVIRTLTGKNQNPYWAIRNRICEKMLYLGHKKNSRLYMFFAQGINKAIREIFLLHFRLSKKRNSKVYAIHGSFLIFPKSILLKLAPVYDENMFLFYEEAYLAKKAHEVRIDFVLTKDISIKHFEDGSTKGSNISLSGFGRQSYLQYYENCCMRSKSDKKQH